MDDPAARSRAIFTVVGDPPRVHEHAGAQEGVYSTDLDCYEFLARHAAPGSRTLETGCGISTALFAVWGTRHTCVVGDRREVDILVEWAAARDIDLGAMTFEIGMSDAVLPRLEPTELDLVFIDGGHAFPMAIIDWYYGAGRLCEGGIVVLDDVQLPSVRLGLFEALERDPR
ncbi:class I SAM-dependent methyltransferase [Baekduia soli]|uniref:Class I SAM-dependent methyltransferase n=1 Tax=Baekduia soli TaxID=496014 RepID=A0A5B8U220_9ACTN|nr:class I SAM-dependent methyltransferase [Baekduia soli]QEC46875.1 class I SAM-dependent methyltransferase [Baekduia soli]